MISKEELGLYLKSIRQARDISLRKVDKKTGISYTHLNMIENGKRNVTPALLRNLANVYNVDYLDLYEKAGYIDLIEDETKNRCKTDAFGNSVISIPILGTVKAGYNYLAQENWIGTIDVETSLVGNGDEYFALKVHGDSMSPVLIEDDIVVIKKQNDFENGDIVVAIINSDEATIKKGKKSTNSITLQPLNPSYDPLVFTYDEMKTIPVEIIGIVKQLKREF